MNKNTKNSILEPDTKRAIIAILLFVLSIVSFLAAFGLGGTVGNSIFAVFQYTFGWGAYLVAISLLIIGVLILKTDATSLCWITSSSIVIMFLGVLGIIQLIFGILSSGQASGGQIGYWIGTSMERMFDFPGSLIILSAVFLIAFLVATNVSLIAIWNKISIKKPFQNGSTSSDGKSAQESTTSGEEKKETIWPSLKKILPSINFPKKADSVEFTKNKLADEKTNKPKILFDTNSSEVSFTKATACQSKNYNGFPLNLLEDGGNNKSQKELSSENLGVNSNIIKRTLETFNIEVEMKEINIGPSVTQYTLKPSEGIKLSRIVALQNDLALALATHPIRIEAPIPGKSLVGIEIPNKTSAVVRLKNILENPSFVRSNKPLSFGLGLNVSGNPENADLAKMPHLLIAGSTGSGKSICINSIIVSFLHNNSPERLRMILVDPKRVELSMYNGIPHLLSPVISDPGKAVNALKWAVKEMEDRLVKLQDEGARDIDSYNTKKGVEKLPHIVIIIDELADLMASNSNGIEAGIVRIAQMARAVGIHLIVSTQRPSVEVITGLIKANIPARIAFRVASQIDSRTILDGSGAEKLLGNGDMLFLQGDLNKPRRIQGAFLTEDEVKRAVKFIQDQADKNDDGEDSDKENKEIDIDTPIFADVPKTDSAMEDDLYAEAKEIVLQAGKASASLLQRRLRIGYARAARLIDILEEQKVVGPADGARPREVYDQD